MNDREPIVVPDLVLEADRKDFRLWVWEARWSDQRRVLIPKTDYPIAIGMKGHRTESGLHQIVGKKRNPDWGLPDEEWVTDELREKYPSGIVDGDDPLNPIVSRWLLFDEDEGEGIHGTWNIDSLGTAASHGCIRMRVEDVEELYERVPVGTLLFID